ncbi:hypothetical protein SD81_024005 [Tolypothrix campylonemoides VB511288]|nr:hypothetical protein SD81_024005 [Tolypothrix campylonemoides VB511288]
MANLSFVICKPALQQEKFCRRSQQAEISLKVSNKGGDRRKCEGALEAIPKGHLSFAHTTKDTPLKTYD